MIGPELEARQAAQALERVRDLLGLEGELGGIGHVLEPAAAAAPKVRAGRLDAVGRRPSSTASMTPRPKRERAWSSRTRSAIAGQRRRGTNTT